MIYAWSEHKSGCIEAGETVRYDGQRWRVVRSYQDYVDIYRKFEAAAVVPIDDGDVVTEVEE